MIEWLQEYADIFEVAIGLATVFVWIFYAQLLLSNYRRQRRPKLVINQGLGTALDSRCLLSNMSQEAIHIENVFGTLETERGRFTAPITDFEPPFNEEGPVGLGQRTLQGPVKSGNYMDIGTFRDVLTAIGRYRRLPLAEDEKCLAFDAISVTSLKIVVIAIYGPEDDPIAASRLFQLLHGEHGVRLKPSDLDTQQMFSRRGRKSVKRWLKEQG